MENRNVKNAKQVGYRHAEAFFHMTYFGQKNGNKIQLRIWNSRDGVTPFTTFCKEYNIRLEHVNFGLGSDVFAPDYKPKKGDLIWVSHTKETARVVAENAYTLFVEHLKHLKKLPKPELLKQIGSHNTDYLEAILADKNAFIEKKIVEILEEHGEPEPNLILVEEDWK